MIIECPECGEKNTTDKSLQPGKRYRCGKCGKPIVFLQTDATEVKEHGIPKIVDTYIGKDGLLKAKVEKHVPAVENTSGQGKLAVVPREIEGWNWGAFLLNWIWSICNNVWIGLLSLIPYAGIIMVIILGVKGNEWAWQYKRWDSIEHFKRTQKTWRDWGVGLLITGICLWLIISALTSY